MNRDEAENFNEFFRSERKKKREALAPERFRYAQKAFQENGIPFVIADESKGCFNLLKNGRVVMSFWSYTGRAYIPSIRWGENIGINNCMKKYKEMFGGPVAVH